MGMTGATNQIHGTSYDQAPDWRTRSLCATEDPELFFSFDPAETAEAKRICRACPVRAECLAFAQDTGATDGVFGGLDGPERRALATRRPVLSATTAAAGRCTAPGRTRGVEAHRAAGEPLCLVCAGYARRIEIRAQRRRRVEALHRDGTPPQRIAQILECSLTTVMTDLDLLGLRIRQARPAGPRVDNACGSQLGYDRHRGRKEAPCLECRAAHSAYETERAAARKAARAAEAAAEREAGAA